MYNWRISFMLPLLLTKAPLADDDDEWQFWMCPLWLQISMVDLYHAYLQTAALFMPTIGCYATWVRGEFYDSPVIELQSWEGGIKSFRSDVNVRKTFVDWEKDHNINHNCWSWFSIFPIYWLYYFILYRNVSLSEKLIENFGGKNSIMFELEKNIYI